MPHNPALIVRLLYGERAQKREPRRSAFSQSRKQQFDIRPSRWSRLPFENAWNGDGASRSRFRKLILCPARCSMQQTFSVTDLEPAPDLRDTSNTIEFITDA